MNPTLLKGIEVSVMGSLVAAGATIDDNSTIIDMAGYDGVMFVQPISDSVGTGVAAITVEQNSANSDTGMVAAAGAVATATSAADDDLNDQCLIVDIYKPRERYVQCVRTSLTANIAFGELIAIRYGVGKKPVIQPVSVAASTSVTSPV